MKKTTILTSILLGLLYVSATKIQAQRLPTVQKESVLAPAGIKIDGNTNEWHDQFKAYNRSTSIFYTMANDNNNLYLIIQATNIDIIGKIFGGGITFTIKNPAVSKAVPFSITYPLIPKNNQSSIFHQVRDTSINIINVLPVVNNETEASSKEIKIAGCQAITDSIISVYNEYGIKAAGLFNTRKAYTYELAVPLKYFDQLIDTTGTLNYNIRLNGISLNNISATLNGVPVSASSPQVIALMAELSASSANTDFLNKTSPTDLSGTYTLAK